MTTYIVLVNWNGWRDTIECLESLFRLDHPDFVVVVCDNGSNDDSLERVREWARGERVVEPSDPALTHLVSPPVAKPIKWQDYRRAEAERGGDLSESHRLVLIQTGANLGFAGGNNVGFRFALARGDADYVWALNNDTVVMPDSLSMLLARIAGSADIGLCGATVCFAGAPERVQALGGAHYNPWLASVTPLGLGLPVPEDLAKLTDRIEHRLSYIFGASMLASKRFLEEVGLMYEDYFLFFEELDWAIRARRHGFRLAYAPLARIYHKAGATTGSGQETALSLYFLNASRLKFAARFFPLLLPLNWLALAWECSKAVLRGQWLKAQAIACALFGVRLFPIPSRE